MDDWAFALTDRARCPKPALSVVERAFEKIPFYPDLSRPYLSVVVCSYNGARTIRECLEGLRRLEYPNYEVIVVNDGSTDATAAIAGEYDVRLINTDQKVLSNARNVGWRAAQGDIVVYIDDDAYPDPHWLAYLAASFGRTNHVGIVRAEYSSDEQWIHCRLRRAFARRSRACPPHRRSRRTHPRL